VTSQEKQIISNYIKRTMIHFFKNSITTIKLPDKFTYPFHYTPHPLCIIATKEVQAYLTSQSQWQKELQQGKMFGVLIVQTPENKIGYLAAFSGTLAGKNCHPFFPIIFLCCANSLQMLFNCFFSYFCRKFIRKIGC
jgi:hypothetical protein